MLRSSLFTASLAALAFSSAAAAQERQADGSAEAHGDHRELNEDIVVTGPIRRDRIEVLSGVSVVTGDVLARELRPTIGETLARQPGISATSFGPAASRPVLRGFQGERVRILADGIGSFDVSNTSVDHAVVINPLTADRIEVLRGPSSLLYGSSAIGGVVNVIDSRIPRSLPTETVHIDAIANYGSAANDRSVGSRVDLAIGDILVLHVDGSYAKSGNLDTGTFILTPALRAQAAASSESEIRELADLRGDLPNSAARTWEVAGGAALITDTGNIGFAVSHYDSLYGVPVRYSLDPTVEAEQVQLDVRQTRVDVRAEIFPQSGFVEAIKFRGGLADYRHDELEDTGEIGTSFFNDAWEGRLELVQRASGNWSGAFGGQFFLRSLNVVGEEKFVPRSRTEQYGLFTVQSFDLGAIRLDGGARIERSVLQAFADADIGNPDTTRSFTAVSGSLGGSVALADGVRLGLNASYTERAPSAEELFANGPHKGTQAFEIGNPDFDKETSTGLELVLNGSGDGYSFSASAYYNWFDGFIFEAPTGDIDDDLPVFQFTQANARHYGLEAEASVRLAQIGAFAINVDALGDVTRATIRGGGPVPRIPALRLLGGLEAQSDTLTARVEAEWVDGQDRIAAFETATDGYTMVNASVSFRPFGEASPASLVLSANNIFDVEARRHASFLKDFAPLAGRDFRATLRLGF
ncbi:MAG: TonB-dependent receptor [Sphingopyxis sp.]|nr:TonB-dependent receptor [Sphingopyxis sp.]